MLTPLPVALVLAACGGEAGPPDAGPAVVPTPAPVKAACREAQETYTGTVRCPAVLPAGRPGARRPVELEFGGRARTRGCGWLLGAQIAGMERNPSGAFHVLVAGQCGPFDLAPTSARAWPRQPDVVEPELGLVSRGAMGGWTRPRVLGRTRVGLDPALIVAYGPYPGSGTVHGGHQALIWNAGGEGHAVSIHFRRDLSPAARLAMLRRVAASTR